MTTRSLLLALCVLALAAPSVRANDHADGFEWAGVWQKEGGGTRTVQRRDGNLLSVERTVGKNEKGTDVVLRLHGTGSGSAMVLTGTLPTSLGLCKPLAGETHDVPAGSSFRLAATRLEDDEDGNRVADVQVTGPAGSTRERWTRRGPTTLEITSCSAQDGWSPKSGALRLEYRLRGAPARLRLRVLAAPQRGGDARIDERRTAAYRALARADGQDLVVHEAALGDDRPVKRGTHEATWDGRDDTQAKRLVHGGQLRLVIEAVDAPGVERAERALEVAAPVTKVVAPNWPKSPIRPEAPHRTRDLGRNRAPLNADIEAGVGKQGFAGPGAHQPTATFASLLSALESSAVVFVATHGDTASILLYTTERDDEVAQEHIEEVRAGELWDQLGLVVRQETPESRPTRVRADKSPLRDLHTVVIWACLAGTRSFPESLLERGCDNVVGFSQSIESSGDQFFCQALLSALLDGDPAREGQPYSVSEASQVAAAFASQQVWDETRRQTERDRRATNQANRGNTKWIPFTESAPYTDCLVTYTAGVTDADTHLEVARWGNSTNTTDSYARTALPASEFTGGTAPSPSDPSTPKGSRLEPVTRTKSSK